MWWQVANTLLGIWLMAAPAVLGYAGPARTVDRIVGPLVAGFAFVAVWEITRPVRRLNLLTGAWLIAAPWILGYGGAATANSTAVGLLVVVFALRGATSRDAFGGGWSSLWSRQNTGGEHPTYGSHG